MREFRYVLAVGFFICLGHAQAGLLGTNVKSQYYAYGAPYSAAGSPASFVANGTAQQTFCSSCLEGFSLTVSDKQIVFQFFGDGGYWDNSTPSLNTGGLYIENGDLLTFTGATITGVGLDAASDVTGFTSSNITYNAGNIALNWAGLSGIASGQSVVLDIKTAAISVAPEPAPWLMTFMGLSTFGIGLWPRIRRNVAGVITQ